VTRRALAAALGAALVATLPACSLVGGGDTYTLTAYFDRAVSVFPTADVRVLGLPAGSVSEVTIDGDQVRIDMKIPSDVAIPVDATAQIVPQSLIGERYIQISPAFQDGMTAAADGDVIEKTIIPVEPDEALAALKEFLDTLDPEGLGDLVTNLDDDLRGNGTALNDALGSLSELVETFAEKDDVLLRIVDSFDRLNATLVTREQQLGEVLDAFAEASQVLADERQSIEALVSGLADLSRNGLALVGEHSSALRADIATLAEAAATINANLTAVTQLVEAGPDLTGGLIDAYNPELRAFNLRNNFSPLTTELVGLLGPAFCLPVLQDCPVSGVSAGSATPAALSSAGSPITSLLTLLGAPSSPAPRPERALASRVGGFLRDAVSTLVGADG
jgi:phospholipid/cholesterol/gamma-HCH transport system substrate-binding protein